MKINKLAGLISLFLLLSLHLHGQIFDPVSWTTSIKQVDGKTYEIVFTANMEKGWSVYSEYLESEDGPIPTSIVFNEGNHFTLQGKTTEDDLNREEGFDAIFEMNVVKYHDRAVFRQRIVLHDTNTPVKGTITYMTCDDERCLPPAEVNFFVSASGQKIEEGQDEEKEEASLVPGNTEEKLYGIPLLDTSSPAGECESSYTYSRRDKSLWGIFLLGMLGGLLALLTPCVFPMIPLTVSFFTKGAEKGKGTSNSIMYGFFILLVYVVLSVPFHLMDSINPDILNDVSTNVYLNVFFFVVFIIFAFSFFGYYELTLPASWSNKASAAEGIGGVIGIFFMALTLALVSFSCTGPILGALLAGALTADGGAWQLTAGMAGFGLSLALPFTLFALFPGWMGNIPKSGSWLNTVKVVLGFLELALALKFLSNADLVQHWGLLRIEAFLGLWIIVFVGIALYLFGKIKFPHDSKVVNLKWPRVAFAVLSLTFAGYLASGYVADKSINAYKPLKLLSGLAPPAGYSWAYPNDCPNNLNCIKDLNEGLAYAKETGKPIMIDFTGYACVNCRKMEEHIWPDKTVYKYLNEDYVLISLYVDDKKELPEAERIEVARVNGGMRMLENYGHKWAHFQTKYFSANSQPFYVLLSSDGQTLLSEPLGYTPDASEYARFLECGLETNASIKPFGAGNMLIN